MCPPIEKMDSSLGGLKACRHLALSTNNIDKIGSLGGLEKLEILSLGRNCLKKLENLDAIAGTLRELWLSYNQIDRLVRAAPCSALGGARRARWPAGRPGRASSGHCWGQATGTACDCRALLPNWRPRLQAGIEKCANLRVLFISNNKLKDWAELERLGGLSGLEELLLVRTCMHACVPPGECVVFARSPLPLAPVHCGRRGFAPPGKLTAHNASWVGPLAGGQPALQRLQGQQRYSRVPDGGGQRVKTCGRSRGGRVPAWQL